MIVSKLLTLRARRLILAALFFVVVPSALPGQSFVVHGSGDRDEYVELPQPLTTGSWQVELESYGDATQCRFVYAPFTLTSDRYRTRQTVASATGTWRKSLDVGKRDFPSGQATIHQGDTAPAGAGVPWSIRFTKEGTPKPLPPLSTTFTLYGRGSPEEPIALGPLLTPGMWRIELRFYPRRYVPEDKRGRFYLTTDPSGCSVVNDFDRRNRVNVTAEALAHEEPALDVHKVPRTLLWSVQFSKEGTSLPSEPPPPPSSCPEDSACRTPVPEPPRTDDDCPDTRACLNGGRFWVAVHYYDGHWKEASVLSTANLPDSAAIFWFFEPNNAELLVKVLNGCAINGHWWVYGSAATDRNYEVVVKRPGTDGLRFRRVSPAVPISYTTGFPCLAGE